VEWVFEVLLIRREHDTWFRGENLAKTMSRKFREKRLKHSNFLVPQGGAELTQAGHSRSLERHNSGLLGNEKVLGGQRLIRNARANLVALVLSQLTDRNAPKVTDQ